MVNNRFQGRLEKAGSGLVMARFATRDSEGRPIIRALRSPDRDRRDKPGDDEATTNQLCRRYTPHFFG